MMKWINAQKAMKTWLPGVFLVLMIGLLAGCGPSGPNAIKVDDYMLVSVLKGETIPVLAKKYLGSEDLSWVIEEYNSIQNVHVGQKIIIPLTPPHRGGLKASEYRTVTILRYTGFQGVSAGQFKAHLKWLNDNGYKIISLDDFFSFQGSTKFAGPMVVITIDEEDDAVYKAITNPIKELKSSATVFVTTSKLETKGHLNAAKIKEMAGSGIDFGCAGHTGRDLSEPKGSEKWAAYMKRASKELSDAQKALSSAGGGSCKALAYPEGNTSSVLVALMKKEGFKAGLTERSGGNAFFTSPYRLYRTTVSASSSPASLAKAIKTTSDSALQ